MLRFKHFLGEAMLNIENGTDKYRDAVIQAVEDDTLQWGKDHSPLTLLNKGEVLKWVKDNDTLDKFTAKFAGKRIINTKEQGLILFTQIDKAPFSGFGSATGKARAEDMEAALCVAHNRINMGLSELDAIKETLSKSDATELSSAESSFLPLAEKCIANLKGVKLPNEVMYHTGKMKGDFTDFWMTQYELSGKSPNDKTKTFKSDMICGGFGISLKQADGSQLLSGIKGEVLATWQAAYDTVNAEGGLDADLKKLMTEFKETIKTQFRPTMSLNGKDVNDYKRDFKNLPPDWKKRYEKVDGKYVLKKDATDPTFEYEHKVKGKVKKFAGSASGFYAEMQDILTSHTSMQDKIREILKNEKVLTAFVHEAMSGKKKFKTNNMAAATHIMTFDGKGNCVNKKITMAYANSLLEYVNIQLNFKTSSRSGYTSVRGGVSAQNLDDIIKNMVRSECYSADGQLINEGWIKNIFGFFTKMFKRVFSEIRRILSNGFSGLKSLFGITDIDIKFNNNIKF